MKLKSLAGTNKLTLEQDSKLMVLIHKRRKKN